MYYAYFRVLLLVAIIFVPVFLNGIPFTTRVYKPIDLDKFLLKLKFIHIIQVPTYMNSNMHN